MKPGDRVSKRRNDEERRLWVLNDEGLYDAMRRSGKSMRAFIRENREFIDGAIDPVLDGTKPAHHLKYGSERKLCPYLCGHIGACEDAREKRRD